MRKMHKRGFIIRHDPAVERVINAAHRQTGEQADIPGVIAVRTFINAPDIEPLFL